MKQRLKHDFHLEAQNINHLFSAKDQKHKTSADGSELADFAGLKSLAWIHGALPNMKRSMFKGFQDSRRRPAYMLLASAEQMHNAASVGRC